MICFFFLSFILAFLLYIIFASFFMAKTLFLPLQEKK